MCTACAGIVVADCGPSEPQAAPPIPPAAPPAHTTKGPQQGAHEEPCAAALPGEVKIGSITQEFEIALTPAEVAAKEALLPAAVNAVSKLVAEKHQAIRDFNARLKLAHREMNTIAQAVRSGLVVETREADIWLDQAAQRKNFRDPATFALFKSQQVEPGDQLHLPMGG